MESKKKRKCIELEANQAHSILKDQLVEIRHVKDWAAKCGYSERKLQRVIKAHFDITPNEKLKEFRFNTIKQTIQKHPDIVSYGVAATVCLKNEQEMYKFLSRDFGTSFRDLKLVVFTQKEMGKDNSQFQNE